MAACAPALADLGRSRPGLLRLGDAPQLSARMNPWGHDVPGVWLWDIESGAGTGLWLGPADETPADVAFRVTEAVQEAAIEAAHGAWPECPHHPGTHPLDVGRQEETVVWVCPAAPGRVVAKVGELPAQPAAAS